jgi:hypothetical protein
MVSIYGLNEKIGNISFYDSQGRDSFTKPYSDDTARVIDEEVSKLIESQYQRAMTILTENKEKLTLLAEKLLTSEVIFKEDLIEIFGERPWKTAELEEVKLVTTDLAQETTLLVESPAESNETSAAEIDGKSDAETNSSDTPLTEE